MADRTFGAARVGEQPTNGASEATNEQKAQADSSYYAGINSKNIGQIKEDLLKRDSAAQEFTQKPLNMFNRDLSVEDPEVNRELHDAMQNAEDMLHEMKESKKMNGAGGGETSTLKSVANLFKGFSKSTDKDKVNKKIREANDIVRRVEESTNLGKSVYLNLKASRVNLQNASAELDRALAVKGMTHDDLMKPSVLTENPDILIKVRELNTAKEHFTDNCQAASEFTLAKNEDASTPSHCQTCNTNTLKRLSAELEQCSQVISPTIGEGEDAEPNPFYKVLSKAPDVDVQESSVNISEPDSLEDSEFMESIKEAVKALSLLNPLKFMSTRNASQTASNSM